MFGEWNWADALSVRWQEGREEGQKEGLEIGLKEGQNEILELLRNGKTRKEIAKELLLTRMVHMAFSESKWDGKLDAWQEEGRKDGLEEGKEEGLERVQSKVLELLRQGYTLEQIEAELSAAPVVTLGQPAGL